ncbi:MAG: slipin family protein [Heliobacteriaceae bacterium]|nr:slipin family protein [Heliobacteriaceae bacterium]MDD4587197.1 slipin family protein [Heliobacteriaceae bacterium]
MDWIESVILFLMVLFVIMLSVRVIGQYERAIVLRFGKFVGVLSPGLRLIIPFGIDRIIRVDIRTTAMDVSGQDIITKDNVPLAISAVVYFNVHDPEFAVLNVENYRLATSLLAQTTLRSVCGAHMLDEVLSEREKIHEMLKQQLDRSTETWGIQVSLVEIKSIDLPEGMKRAMAKQAEAERERRAKVISAQGELQASEKLLEAANVISLNPSTLLLRTLQTIGEISVEKNSTIIFPLPMELLRLFDNRQTK